MASRISVDQFFIDLKQQSNYPVVDTSESREWVERKVRQLCVGYPIQDPWPLHDLEHAYEGYLNQGANLGELVKAGYNGTVNIRGYDHSYSMDEWFGDFKAQWKLQDSALVRRRMLTILPKGATWSSGDLYQAHKKVVEPSFSSVLKSMLGRW